MRDLGGGRYEITNKRTGEKKVVSANELSQYGLSAPQPKQSLLEKVSSFLFPTATKTGKMSVAGLTYGGKTFGGARESVQTALEQSTQMAKRAMQETDPEKKKKLLEMSRQSDFAVQGLTPQLTQTEEQYGMKPGEDINYLRQGLGTGAEIGAWLMPGVGPKGTGIKKAVARGALTGLGSGTLFGLSQQEGNMIANAAKGGVTGFVAGGVLGGLTEAAISTGRAILKKFPVILRQIGLGGKETPAFAEKTLQGLSKEELTALGTKEYKKVPANYKKMGEWGKNVEAKAEKRLKTVKTVSGETYGVKDVMPDVNEDQISDVLTKTVDELKRKLRPQEADALETASLNLLSDQASIQDLLTVKRALDQSVRTTFKKTGREIDAIKKAQRRILSDRVRDTVRNAPGVPKDVGKLLDLQQAAIKIQGLVDASMNKLSKSAVPSWFEIAAVAGPATYGGGLSFAAPSLAAIGISRAFKLPQTSQFLYGLGTQVQRLSPLARNLQQFLTKGAARMATQ